MEKECISQVPPPFLVSYSITTKCNLICKHCYSESSEEAGYDDLTTDEALRVIDEIADWGIGLLVFDGGEPLLREDFFQIADYTIVSHLEDICLRVFIEGYDGLGTGATSHVLAGT